LLIKDVLPEIPCCGKGQGSAVVAGTDAPMSSHPSTSAVIFSIDGECDYHRLI